MASRGEAADDWQGPLQGGTDGRSTSRPAGWLTGWLAGWQRLWPVGQGVSPGLQLEQTQG